MLINYYYYYHLFLQLTNIIYISLATKFQGNPYKKHLFDDLLSNYNRLIRPVQNHSENLTVWIGLKLTQLTEMVIIYFTGMTVI